MESDQWAVKDGFAVQDAQRINEDTAPKSFSVRLYVC